MLIDEDTQDKVLVKLLLKAGHNVVTVNEAGLMSQPDGLVFNYAVENSRVILTHNCRDFEVIHENNLHHFGILAIYKNDEYSKDMSFKEIVKAISNLEAAGII
ncbi:MAG: DUF5615 family PIN-like protein, partial [Xenococcus sp. (in: cyanobacteria)]